MGFFLFQVEKGKKIITTVGLFIELICLVAGIKKRFYFAQDVKNKKNIYTYSDLLFFRCSSRYENVCFLFFLTNWMRSEKERRKKNGIFFVSG